MNDPLHLVCPHCQAINRVPTNRLTETPRCGQCHQPLFTAHPVELTTATFERHINRNDIPVLVDFWAPPVPAQGRDHAVGRARLRA